MNPSRADAAPVDRTADRYRRQRLMAGFGPEEQARLGRAAVLISRTGGLGGPTALSLAAAGVGRLVLHHEGVLEPEDLNRMILMEEAGLGCARAAQAEAALRRFNPEVQVVARGSRITPAEAAAWLETVDLAIGAAPTLEERFILNAACVQARKPYIDAAVCGEQGQILAVRPGASACLRCLSPEDPPWDADFPVLGALSAVVGNLAALLAIRALTGWGSVPWGAYLHIDLASLDLRPIAVPRRPGCPVCGDLQ